MAAPTSALALSLTHALSHEPYYQAISVDAGDAAQRERMLTAYFEYSIQEARALGRVVVSPDEVSGVALWLLPADSGRGAEAGRAKREFLSGTLGPVGFRNYQRIIGTLAAHASVELDPNAWYLSIIGVSPAAQGSGLGSLLLRPTLLEADNAGATCYLESFNPRNVDFYQRLGFRTRVSPVEPLTGATYRIMIRAAA